MAIDNCPYSFDEIVSRRIPELFRMLDAKRSQAVTGTVFLRSGNGYKRTPKALGHDHDFKGCYVFFEKGIPRYVGISKNVIKRLWNHFRAQNHHSSSLVYRVACKGNKIQSHYKTPKGEKYRREFKKALARVRTWTVIYQEIPDDVTLYFFEVYAAMRYDTGENTGGFNSFTTH
jgi:hypothetical protein